jgi:hypothetical protein
MTPLTSTQQAFVEQMAENEELASHGFRLLIQRPDLVKYFDALRDVGLFDPVRNPAPVHTAEGYFRIPYWNALDYLLAVAKVAGQQDDDELGQRVLQVVRAVSSWQDSEGNYRQNFHTAHKFTEILGILPARLVTIEDLRFISLWLRDRFERMLVSTAIDEVLLPHLLNSSNSEDWKKSAVVLEQCTSLDLPEPDTVSIQSARPVIEEYWLEKLIANSASLFASRAPEEAATIFLQRVREAFHSQVHKEHSTIFRAAIEDHAQNHGLRVAENLMVQGLRDVLLGWVEHDSESARKFVRAMLGDDLEIVRRIGIYIVHKHWANLRELYDVILQNQPFEPGHIHEMYNLLKEHFSEVPAPTQVATIEALRALPAIEELEDPQGTLQRLQLRWLSAMVGRGCQAADEWYEMLANCPGVGPLPEHPEFTSYTTTWSGPGASPYSVQELVGFATDHVLANQLNSFAPSGHWRAPTLEGLAATLQDAVRAHPAVFVAILPELRSAKRLYQHAIIVALTEAWTSTDKGTTTVEWQKAWQQLLAFLAALVGDDQLWQDDSHGSAWVVTAIADLLKAGTERDERAFPPELLSSAQAVLEIVLRKTEGSGETSGDPMMQALNTTKGRAIGALFSIALRACRVSDQQHGRHDEAWFAVQPLFDRELNLTQNGNYEFSTHCGAYLPQLEYLNSAWIVSNASRIFAPEYPENDKCAITGLAYASFTRSTYELLVSLRAVERALRYQLPSRETKEKLLERMGIAYLWGIEALDSPRFSEVFASGGAEDLQHLAWFLWTLRGQDLSSEQKEKILSFWERCISWSRSRETVPEKLLSTLSHLACYLNDGEGQAQTLLIAVAPYAHVGHDLYQFVGELRRLSTTSPETVISILKVMTSAHLPEYDYQDELRDLLKALAEGERRLQVIQLLERMRHLQGIHDLYNELTRTDVT